MAILELLRNFWPIDQSVWLTVLAQWTYRLILLNIFRTPEKNPSGRVLSCSIMLSDKVWERRQFVRTDCHRWLSQTCYNQWCHRSLSCTFCHRQRGWSGFFFFSFYIILVCIFHLRQKELPNLAFTWKKANPSIAIYFSFTQEGLGSCLVLCQGRVTSGLPWPPKRVNGPLSPQLPLCCHRLSYCLCLKTLNPALPGGRDTDLGATASRFEPCHYGVGVWCWAGWFLHLENVCLTGL